MRTLGYILIALCCVPSALVMVELFWFAHRCPKGGHHDWLPHPAPHLSASWVQCPKCGEEDY